MRDTFFSLVKSILLYTLLIAGSVIAVTDSEIQKMRQAMPDKPVVQPVKERTMLVFSLCKGFKHSSVPYWAKAMDVMSEKTGAFKVVHSKDMSIFSPDSLAQFDVICLNNTTKLTPDKAQQQAIMDFIKNGKGIVGIHAATDNFYEWAEGMQMMGGVFKGHPWGAKGTWAIKLDEPDHPLMKSFKGQNFKINDEIYRTEAPLYSRNNQRVLMSLDMSDPTTKNAKGVRPDDMDTGITWIKPVGKGRLFYCSLGHTHHVTWNTPVLEHILAGIQYAMGDYKVDDTPVGQASAKLDTARLDSLLDELKDYDWDKSRAATVKIQQLINTHRDNPKTSAVIEGRLVETLDSDISLASKDFICRELSVIGTEQSMPILSKMLADKQTANIARYALEKIPGDMVDDALLESLRQTDQADIQIGIITTLGVRQSKEAIKPLAELACDSNEQVAVAAIGALASITDEKAMDALLVLSEKPDNPSLQPHIQDAQLTCSFDLAKKDDSYRTASNTQNMYRDLYAEKNPSLIRAGALKGLVQSGYTDSDDFLLAAIRGDDVVVREAAMSILSDVEDKRTLEAAALELSALTAPTQIQLLAALASNPGKIGMKQALDLTQSDAPSVRIAAYRTLAQIGDASAVEPLAVAAAQSQEREERQAAQNALYRISGKGVEDEILKKLEQARQANAGDVVVIEYIRAAVQRQSSGVIKTLLPLALSDDPKMAVESVKVLQVLSGPDEMEQLVDILIAKPTAAKETLVVLVGQKESDMNRRAEVLLARYSDVSEEQAQASMLRVMGKLGDSSSIALLKKEMISDSPAIQEAAFRAMTDWPGNDFLEEMKSKAASGSDAKTKILAFRAYVRMLHQSANDRNRSEIAEELINAYERAVRPEEQKFVISTLGDYGTVSALKFVDSKATSPRLSAEAEAALVGICEKLVAQNPSAVKPTLEKLKNSQNKTVSKQVQELLKTVR